MRPNVLLVVLDTARADAVEPFGAPVGSTPAIAALAATGVACRVYATSCWTIPSHASMFTGRLPRTLGLGRGVAPADALRRREPDVLAAVLRDAGYATRAASANPFVSPGGGFDVGFERFDVVTGSRRHRPGRGLRARLRWDLDAVRADIDDGMAAAAAAVRAWVREGPEAPFFWFVNLMECHSPYLPPRPWNDLGLVGRYRAAADARRYQTHDVRARYSLGEIDVPPAALARMRHLYQRSVSAMDAWLADVLGELDRVRALDDTLVIVTSDHGENIGDGHLLGHTLSLDDRLIGVPYVAAGPGATAPRGDAPSLAQLPSLLADAIGLLDHPWQADASPSPVAVAQTDGISTFAPDVRAALTAAWHLPAAIVERLGAPIACATDGRFKLVRDVAAGGERLHDLTADPDELVDVLSSHGAQADRLRAALDRAEEEAHDDGRPPPGGAPGQWVVELEERMRLLGYM